MSQTCTCDIFFCSCRIALHLGVKLVLQGLLVFIRSIASSIIQSVFYRSTIMTSKSPLLPVPIFEFAQHLNPNSKQTDPKSLCAFIERRLADCFEAYGFGKKGMEKCKNLTYDFHECTYSTFQSLRYIAIRKERMRLYREGKLEKPFDEHPPIDGLIYYY